MVRFSPRWLVASVVLAVSAALAGCTPGGGGGGEPAAPEAPSQAIPGY